MFTQDEEPFTSVTGTPSHFAVNMQSLISNIAFPSTKPELIFNQTGLMRIEINYTLTRNASKDPDTVFDIKPFRSFDDSEFPSEDFYQSSNTKHIHRSKVYYHTVNSVDTNADYLYFKFMLANEIFVDPAWSYGPAPSTGTSPLYEVNAVVSVTKYDEV